jgi:hypothetical protein
MVDGVKTRFVLQICDRTLKVLWRCIARIAHVADVRQRFSARVRGVIPAKSQYLLLLAVRALDSGLRRNDEEIRQIF